MLKNLFVITSVCILLTATGGCKKDSGNNTSNNNNNTGNSYFFQATVNQNVSRITNCQPQTYSGAAGVNSQWNYEADAGFGTAAAGDSIMNAAIIMFHNYNNDPNTGSPTDTSIYLPLYAPTASVPFNGPTIQNGIIVDITIGNTHYYTNHGTADQTGSVFTITSRSSVDSLNRVVIAGTFNCKVYDDYGNYRILTNGSYQGQEILH